MLKMADAGRMGTRENKNDDWLDSFLNEPIGNWELDSLDPMAPAYDAFYALKTELGRIFESPKDFREGLRNASAHLVNIFTGYWEHEPFWLHYSPE